MHEPSSSRRVGEDGVDTQACWDTEHVHVRKGHCFPSIPAPHAFGSVWQIFKVSRYSFSDIAEMQLQAPQREKMKLQPCLFLAMKRKVLPTEDTDADSSGLISASFRHQVAPAHTRGQAKEHTREEGLDLAITW